MEPEFTGIKQIDIMATTRYPIVSAYEYEFLKEDKAVQDCMQGCTIYMILQRPLIYFNNVTLENGCINFEITDDIQLPLFGVFNLNQNDICKEDEGLFIDVQFFKPIPDANSPFCDVAAFKILNLKNEFVAWYSPQKLLYQYLTGSLNLDLSGDIENFMDYKVHYIGQAFSQKIWNRLTGHEKMQKILTMEGPFSSKTGRAPFEISLLMLDITGYDEANTYLTFDGLDMPQDPIFHAFTFEDGDDRFDKFSVPAIASNAPELTNEVEALLVNTFKPEYNEIKFEKYPNIKRGTRSVGYTSSALTIEDLPAKLYTKAYKMKAVLSYSGVVQHDF